MDGIIGLVAVGTGYIAILMPVLLIWVIFSYSRKTDRINMMPWLLYLKI